MTVHHKRMVKGERNQEESNSNIHTVHIARVPAPHKHSQHNQCRTPYAVVNSLVLLEDGHNDARNMLK